MDVGEDLFKIFEILNSLKHISLLALAFPIEKYDVTYKPTDAR